MNKDVHFQVDNDVFNYRVAAIIKKDDKYLLELSSLFGYYTLIGGRCNILESSSAAIIREVKEETGIDTKIVKEIGILENFFSSNYNHKNYHEILFIYELEFVNEEDYLKDIKNIEGKDERLEWVSKEDLSKINFNPHIILDNLNNNNFYHIINRDK